MKSRTVFNLVDGSTIWTEVVELSRTEVEEVMKKELLPSLAKSTYLKLSCDDGMRIVMLHAIVDFHVEEV